MEKLSNGEMEAIKKESPGVTGTRNELLTENKKIQPLSAKSSLFKSCEAHVDAAKMQKITKKSIFGKKMKAARRYCAPPL